MQKALDYADKTMSEYPVLFASLDPVIRNVVRDIIADAHLAGEFERTMELRDYLAAMLSYKTVGQMLDVVG